MIAGRVVGFDGEVARLAAAVRHDLSGAAVVPGFHDAHQHLGARGEELRRCDLSPTTVTDLDDLAAALTRYAADLPPDAWCSGSASTTRSSAGCRPAGCSTVRGAAGPCGSRTPRTLPGC